MLKNKSHFVLLQMWHLIAVRIGENAEVRPLLVPVTHSAQLIMALFLEEAEKMQGLDPCLQVATTSRGFDNVTLRCSIVSHIFFTYPLHTKSEWLCVIKKKHHSNYQGG